MRKHNGFTIVELLIVIVIIGILAAISIVTYSGIQNSAHVSAVKNDFASIAKQAALFKVASTTDTYPFTTDDMRKAGFAFSKNSYNAVLLCHEAVNIPGVGWLSYDWAIIADVKDGKTYIYDNENAVTTEFTKGKVQNASGGTTCPSVRPNLTVWVWVKQTTNGNWQY